LHGAAGIAPRFGEAVDIVFLALFVVFLMLTLALVAGCAALERKK
jgi:hypothetical protein